MSSKKREYEDEINKLVEEVGTAIGNNKIQYTQAKLTARLILALNDAKESSNHHAHRMMGLSLVVGLIALMQLLFAIWSSSLSSLHKSLSAIIVISALVFAFRDYFGAKNRK